MLTTTTNPVKKIKTFFKLNKYEEKIMFLAFLPAALVFMTFISIVFIATPKFSMAVFHTSLYSLLNPVEELSGMIVAALCIVYLASITGILILARRMSNSFDHITSDLNEILAGYSEEIQKNPPNAALNQDIRKSVNEIVVRYLEEEKKKKAS